MLWVLTRETGAHLDSLDQGMRSTAPSQFSVYLSGRSVGLAVASPSYTYSYKLDVCLLH